MHASPSSLGPFWGLSLDVSSKTNRFWFFCLVLFPFFLFIYFFWRVAQLGFGITPGLNSTGSSSLAADFLETWDCRDMTVPSFLSLSLFISTSSPLLVPPRPSPPASPPRQFAMQTTRARAWVVTLPSRTLAWPSSPCSKSPRATTGTALWRYAGPRPLTTASRTHQDYLTDPQTWHWGRKNT